MLDLVQWGIQVTTVFQEIADFFQTPVIATDLASIPLLGNIFALPIVGDIFEVFQEFLVSLGLDFTWFDFLFTAAVLGLFVWRLAKFITDIVL